MIQLGLFFLGIFVYTFGLNLFAQYRRGQMQFGGVLGIFAACWALFTNIYLFLVMIPLFFIFRKLASYLVFLFFKKQYPKAVNLDWKTFQLRETYRENKKPENLLDGKCLEGMVSKMEAKNKELEEFCDNAYKVTGIKETLQKHDEKKESLKSIYSQVLTSYGGIFTAKAIITAPYYLNKYLETINKPGHFLKPNTEIKMFGDIDPKEKQFLGSLNESFGFPDLI